MDPPKRSPRGGGLLNRQTWTDLGNDPERRRQYGELLQQDIDEELRHLHAALQRDDRDELGRAAHTLKGLCGHLTNPVPAELAARLQRNAGSMGHEEIQRIVDQVRATCLTTGKEEES